MSTESYWNCGKFQKIATGQWVFHSLSRHKIKCWYSYEICQIWQKKCLAREPWVGLVSVPFSQPAANVVVADRQLGPGCDLVFVVAESEGGVGVYRGKYLDWIRLVIMLPSFTARHDRWACAFRTQRSYTFTPVKNPACWNDDILTT